MQLSPPAQGEPGGLGRATLRELAAEHAPDPLLLAQQGEVSWISDSIADCLGWSAADLGQARLMHLCHHQDQKALAALLDSAAGGGIHRAVVRMRSKDDRYLNVLVTLGPGNGHGSDTLVGTIREIDRRVQREQQADSLLDWHLELGRITGEALLQIDDTGVVTWASAAITALIGWSPAELVGRGPAELAHPEDTERLRASWSPASSRVPYSPVEFRCTCKDGSWKWLQAQGVALPARQGQPTIRISQLRDISQRIVMRQHLADELAHHQIVIDSFIDPFVLVKAERDDTGAIVDFTFIEANRAACDLKRVASQDLIGTRLLGDHPMTEQAHLFKAYLGMVERGEPSVSQSWPQPLPLSGGPQRAYEMRAVRFGDWIGQTWRDITDRTAAEALIRHSEVRLRAVMDAMVDPQILCEPIPAEDGGVSDFLIEEANTQACSYADARVDELIGSTLRTKLPELLEGDLLQRYLDVVDTGAAALMDDIAVSRPSEGSERVFDIRCTQVQGSQVNLTWRDVTERQRNRQRLAESENRLRTIMDAAPVGMARVSVAGRFEEVNPALTRMLMRDPTWLRRHGISDVLHPEDSATHERCRMEVAQGAVASVAEERLVRADGHGIWVLHSLAGIRNDAGEITAYISQFEDIDEAHRVREQIGSSERLYRLLAQNASDVVMHLRDGDIAWISPSVATVLGGTQAEWSGRSMREFIHPFDLRVFDEVMTQASAGQAIVRRARVCTHDGSYHWLEAHATAFRDESGQSDGISVSLRNVDVEVQALAELDRQARIDTLTGLVTRREAMHRIEQAAGSDREPGGRMALLFCDIDHFKDINDRYGHAAGDAVLRTMATRISEAVRLDDVVSRIGGDELLVLIGGLHGLKEATEVAEKIREVARQPITIDGEQVTSSLSIGVTLAQPGEPAEALIGRADAAMYQAKGGGRNQVAAIAARSPSSQMSPPEPSPNG